MSHRVLPHATPLVRLHLRELDVVGLGADVGLAHGVALGVADGDGLVVTAQGQQVLTAPLATRDLLGVLAQDGNLATKNTPKVETLLQ